MASLVAAGEVRSYAAALDKATPTATGDVAAEIARLQQLATKADVQTRLAAQAPQLASAPLTTAAQSLETALQVVGDRASTLLGGDLPARPGLQFSGTLPTARRAGSWIMSFDRDPAAGAAAPVGRTSGFATGVDVAPSDHWRFGFAMVRQLTDQRLGGGQGAGTGRTTLVTGQALYAPGDGLNVGATAAFGSGTFSGARPVLGGTGAANARFDERSTLAAFETTADYAIPEGGWLHPTLTGRLGLRSTSTGGAREVTTSGLGLATQGGRYRWAEGAVGLRIAPGADVVAPVLGSARLTFSLAGSLVHRLGDAAPRVRASFIDMPELQFDLEGARSGRTRVDVDAGLILATKGGMALSAGVRSWQPAGAPVHEARVGIKYSF
jgi:hypothetical protein